MPKEGISDELQDQLEEHLGGGAGRSGTVVVDKKDGYVGDTITLKGRNFPANESLDVVWHTVDGSWAILKANTLHNPQYRPKTERILTVTTDDNGEFDETWQVKEDYGGEHTIEVQTDSGTALASCSYTVKPHFELDRTKAPMGEFFHVTGYGLGPDRSVNNYSVTWNNSYVGFMTGVENHGTAHADVRAVGPPRENVIQVWRGHEGMPYMQGNTTSVLGPVADGRQTVWTVEVTEPDERPPTASLGPLLDETPLEPHMLEPEEDTEATLDVSPTSGQPGTTAFITGQDFPADTEVDLVWYTHSGHRFMSEAITPEPRPDVLPTVVTDDEGSFQEEITVPRDIGETRPIVAEVDGTSVATTGFVLQPAIKDISPEKGPVGTQITVEVVGLGWALYDNNWSVIYDNHPVGYVCSHNRKDDDNETEGSIVKFELRASGDPGLHFIDMVPTFNENEVDDFELVDRPHLSHVNNHPLRPEPGLHFTFEVTEE